MGYSKQRFFNEILGESADFGVKLVTINDIKAASKLGPNTYLDAMKRLRGYRVKALGVDWGGGGEAEVSFTVVVICALNPINNRIECHFAERFPLGTTYDDEARALIKYFLHAGAMFFAHDYGGSGSVRETMMLQAGLPPERVIGFRYTVAPTRHMIFFDKPAQSETRGCHNLDKPKSLTLQAMCIKAGSILLPDYESSKVITHDLLSLMEDKRTVPGGSDRFLIRRQPKMPDDFAHALNYACCAIWHAEQRYPNLSQASGLGMSSAQISFLRESRF
jgi:hypothetical protein